MNAEREKEEKEYHREKEEKEYQSAESKPKERKNEMRYFIT